MITNHILLEQDHGYCRFAYTTAAAGYEWINEKHVKYVIAAATIGPNGEYRGAAGRSRGAGTRTVVQGVTGANALIGMSVVGTDATVTGVTTVTKGVTNVPSMTRTTMAGVPPSVPQLLVWRVKGLMGLEHHIGKHLYQCQLQQTWYPLRWLQHFNS